MLLLKALMDTPVKPEKVLVVTTADLLNIHNFQGVTVHAKVIDFIENSCIKFSSDDDGRTFLPRSEADATEGFKQICTYSPVYRVANGQRQYLAYYRSFKGEESRLHGRMSLGFGGHVNDSDDCLQAAVERELKEELPGIIEYASPFSLDTVGIINEDKTEVGRVHVGAVVPVAVDCTYTPVIGDGSTDATIWLTYDEIMSPKYFERFEVWSRFLATQFLLK